MDIRVIKLCPQAQQFHSLVLKVLLDQSGRTEDTTKWSSLHKPKLCAVNSGFAREGKDKRNSPFSYCNNQSSCIPGGLRTAKPSLAKGYGVILKYPSPLLKTLLQFKRTYELCIQNTPQKDGLYLIDFQDSFTTTGTHLLHDLTCQMQLTGQFLSDTQVCRWGKYQTPLCYKRFAI